MSGLFGIRAIAEAVDLDAREVMAMVRSGHGDRLVGMVNRKRKRPTPAGWEGFISSIEEIGFDVDWTGFIQSAEQIN